MFSPGSAGLPFIAGPTLSSTSVQGSVGGPARLGAMHWVAFTGIDGLCPADTQLAATRQSPPYG